MKTSIKILVALTLLASVLESAFEPAAGSSNFAFGPPRLVDPARAGGEPSIFVIGHGPHRGEYLYAAHAGTTHLYRPNAAKATDFLVPYRGQTYIWRSQDGNSWQLVDILGSGVHSTALGFSDPDFAEDSAGNVYEPEIDLPNVSLNSSTDGGRTWLGNPFAFEGDRPWVAGDTDGIVYLAINPSSGNCDHVILKSFDRGLTFPQRGCDVGQLADGSSAAGYGKLLVDRTDHAVYEPVLISAPSSDEFSFQGSSGIGIGKSTDGGLTFIRKKVADSNFYGLFPSLTQDSAGTLYLVWDEADRRTSIGFDCGCNSTKPVAIKYSYSRDKGETWSAPVEIAKAGSSVPGSPFWPWATAGAGGMLSVAWFQRTRLSTIDSEKSDSYIYAAQVALASSASPSIEIVNASGKPVHTNEVCQEGTFCMVNGKDRRLGDYLTTYLDPEGHMMIAYADTTSYSSSIVSRPGLIRQISGYSFNVSRVATVVQGKRFVRKPRHKGGLVKVCRRRHHRRVCRWVVRHHRKVVKSRPT